MDNKDLVQLFFTEIWNGRKTKLLDTLLRFPYEIENLLSNTPPEPVSREEMERHFREWFKAFPDLQVSVRQTVAEAGRVFVETRYIGTHLGTYRGLEATGNGINICVLAVFQVGAGKLSGHSVLVDALGLYRQLGFTLLEPGGPEK